MEWIQRNRKAAAALATLVVLSGLVLAWVLTSGSGSPPVEPTLAVPTTTPTRAPLTVLPTPSASATPSAVATSLEGAGIAGYSSLTGLKGHSVSASYPSHHIVLSLTSSRKLPFVIYNIPTSRDNRGGTITDHLGRTWSVQTTVYGKPDYAQVFTRADWYGTPITCTITVDGRVTAHLTTSGPYGKVFCQG
jgi:hypothetical protein